MTGGGSVFSFSSVTSLAAFFSQSFDLFTVPGVRSAFTIRSVPWPSLIVRRPDLKCGRSGAGLVRIKAQPFLLGDLPNAPFKIGTFKIGTVGTVPDGTGRDADGTDRTELCRTGAESFLTLTTVAVVTYQDPYFGGMSVPLCGFSWPPFSMWLFFLA